MNLLQAIILGIVQGLTEYIPVSSSAHLVLIPWLAGWPEPSFAFDVLVQWGTLVGVFIYFWQDIWQIASGVLRGLWERKPLGNTEARLGWLIVLATLPAVFFGLAFKDAFEAAFSAPHYCAAFLIVTSGLLLLAERLANRKRDLKSMTWLDAVVVGLFQAVALLPGISRSGATISGGLMRGLDRTSAARFSFLMSIPALIGAGTLALYDLVKAGVMAEEIIPVAAGAAIAAITGYLSIRWLLGYLQKRSLKVFAYYCLAFGLINLAIYFLSAASRVL